MLSVESVRKAVVDTMVASHHGSTPATRRGPEALMADGRGHGGRRRFGPDAARLDSGRRLSAAQATTSVPKQSVI
jgi:hypothetical protein